MKDYLVEINNLFPVRRKEDEKSAFYEYVCSELGQERVKLEQLDKNNNIVIGNVQEARVVITAHYDTPAASLVPNFMIPANKVIGTLIALCYPLAMALFSIMVAFGSGALFSLDDSIIMFIYLVLYFSLFFGSTRLISNKNNKNDNTSGVSAVMTLASSITSDKVAFILFDNEEKGLLGSKAYNKNHKELMKDKLVINLDCVGNGNNMIFITKEDAERKEEYELLRDAFSKPSKSFAVHYIPYKKSCGFSDHRSFPCSVCVMAANKGKIVRFITGRIHTSRDTVADGENISFLCSHLSDYINNL